MDNITIKIYKACDEDGYFYDIYNQDDLDNDEDAESLDGGFCTGEMLDASGMAHEQLKNLLINQAMYK
jgi:hypothetical protein